MHASRRHENLSFTHHEAVADLSASQQRLVLDRAEREGWNRDQVRQEAWKLTHQLAPSQGLTLDPQLYHGDCREILDRLPARSVHLLLTDPPYGLSYKSPMRIVPLPRMADDNSASAPRLLDEALAAVAWKLLPNSAVYLFTSSKTLLQMIDVVASHFTVLSTLSWVKNQWSVGDLWGDYGDQQELVIVAVNAPRRRGGPCDARVLSFARVGGNQLCHPTQKPVPLLRDIITTSSRQGDTVLDPFMGSGSTCLAARDTGRGYIGIEIAKNWYELALRRMAEPASEGNRGRERRDGRNRRGERRAGEMAG